MRTHVDASRPSVDPHRVQRVFKSPRSLIKAGVIGETVVVQLTNGHKVQGRLRHVGATHSGVKVDGIERSFRNQDIKRVVIP